MPQSSSNYQSPFTSGLNRHKPTFPLQAPSSHDQRAFPPSSRLPPSNKQDFSFFTTVKAFSSTQTSLNPSSSVNMTTCKHAHASAIIGFRTFSHGYFFFDR
ncbi:hypothetical protein ES319_D06G150400v1 [Gossypium barbadense]|uniref:Uncharacterized protein n=1 Tax=Gossypium barbadense TaxID=3634 RepID=A0A5J5R3U6_GOSBA|nr:hypothetical protein ES319_D06G150400v1 [Gossypium barbadense]